VASIARRPDGQWRARYRDTAGKEHSKHFDRKTDAQRWLDEVTAAIVTGQYVDPRSGRITFREYAERWRATQVHRLTTQEYIEGNLRRNPYPVLGDKPLSSIRPSEVGVGQGHDRSVGTIDRRRRPWCCVGHLSRGRA
jgi:hypothetical protein